MNAQPQLKLAREPEDPVARLRAARVERDRVAAALDAINADMARIEAAAAPAASAASGAASLRQQRVGLLARMLRAGGIDPAQTRDLDRQLAAAEPTERQAADVAAAKAVALAELQAQHVALVHQLQAAQLALLQAQLNAFGEHILAERVPAVRSALERLRDEYAALAAAGIVHVEMTRQLRDQGISASSLGTDWPIVEIGIAVVGFGVADRGQTNVMWADARPQIDRAAADMRARWNS